MYTMSDREGTEQFEFPSLFRHGRPREKPVQAAFELRLDFDVGGASGAADRIVVGRQLVVISPYKIV